MLSYRMTAGRQPERCHTQELHSSTSTDAEETAYHSKRESKISQMLVITKQGIVSIGVDLHSDINTSGFKSR